MGPQGNCHGHRALGRNDRPGDKQHAGPLGRLRRRLPGPAAPHAVDRHLRRRGNACRSGKRLPERPRELADRRLHDAGRRSRAPWDRRPLLLEAELHLLGHELGAPRARLGRRLCDRARDPGKRRRHPARRRGARGLLHEAGGRLLRRRPRGALDALLGRGRLRADEAGPGRLPLRHAGAADLDQGSQRPRAYLRLRRLGAAADDHGLGRALDRRHLRRRSPKSSHASRRALRRVRLHERSPQLRPRRPRRDYAVHVRRRRTPGEDHRPEPPPGRAQRLRPDLGQGHRPVQRARGPLELRLGSGDADGDPHRRPLEPVEGRLRRQSARRARRPTREPHALRLRLAAERAHDHGCPEQRHDDELRRKRQPAHAHGARAPFLPRGVDVQRPQRSAHLPRRARQRDRLRLRRRGEPDLGHRAGRRRPRGRSVDRRRSTAAIPRAAGSSPRSRTRAASRRSSRTRAATSARSGRSSGTGRRSATTARGG